MNLLAFSVISFAPDRNNVSLHMSSRVYCLGGNEIIARKSMAGDRREERAILRAQWDEIMPTRGGVRRYLILNLISKR